MTDHLGPLSEPALAELLRRRLRAREMVAAGTLDRAEAEARVARWCGIAAWFGAVLPRELHPDLADLRWPETTWLLWSAEGQSADSWREEIAHELRRAAEAALAAHEANRADKPREARARALLAMDRRLSLAAGLPAIGAAEQKAAA